MTEHHAIPVDLLPPDYRVAITTGPLAVPHGDGHYTVPSGFVTDFASIPRALWRLWPPWGPWTPAAIMHDHHYTVRATSRAEADRRFREAMRLHGVGWLTRWTFWAGVRLAGRSHWHA